MHLLPEGAGTSFAHTAAGIGRLVTSLASRERPLLPVLDLQVDGLASAYPPPPVA